MRPVRSALIAGVAVGALVLAGAVPAVASSSDADPDAVASAVAEAAPTELRALPVESIGDALSASFTEGGGVELSIAAADGISFAAADGQSGATISLPGAARLGDAVVSEDGTVTYPGDAQVPSVNVSAAEDATRISTVITDASQTEAFDYDFGAGATVEIQDDGSALVLSNETREEGVEAIIAAIDAPWAVDASGASVETRYVASGSVLTQVVEHRDAAASYPVVADPTFDNPNIIQYRVRFNRAETAAIAAGGWGGVVGSFSCGAMAAVCALATGTLAYQAGVAQNSKPKKCVQVTATQPIVIPGMYWWVDTYSGGPCR